MTLDRPAMLGIVFGVVIGAVYFALQRWELRQKNQQLQPKGVMVLIPGAIARLAVAMMMIFLVFQFTDANKYWLTGALLVTYTAPLLWQLKEMLFPKT